MTALIAAQGPDPWAIGAVVISAIAGLYTAFSNRKTSREDLDLKRFDTFTAKVLKDNETVRAQCVKCEHDLEALREEKDLEIADLRAQLAELKGAA